MMGEFQISNLPLIIIAIVLISLGVLGFFEIKKLYIKLNSIISKIDEINEALPKNQTGQQVQQSNGQQGNGQQRPPPHIIEQQRMMMLQQQQQRQQQQQQQQQVNQQKMSEELSMPQDNKEGNKDFEDDINYSENSDDYTTTSDDDIKSSEGGDIKSTSDVDDPSVLKDITNEDVNSQNSQNSKNSHVSEMTIELDNEFKHMSIKELKDLCKEKDLIISGNKSTLIERLLKKE